MRRFAALIDRLALTPQRNRKLALLEAYIRETEDPDRGYAVAALAGELRLRSVPPSLLRALAYERVDRVLFDLSYDYVGDLAETIALSWPAAKSGVNDVTLSATVERLAAASRREAPALVEALLDALDAQGRWALLKLATGGFRIGVSARLVKAALAGFGGRETNEIEELWHGLAPPYLDLFAWLEGRADKPRAGAPAAFRPAMLAHPLSEEYFDALDPRDFIAEWKWDGVRAQAVAEGGARRLYSRTGDDLGPAFPDVLAALPDGVAMDGELLIFDPGAEGFRPRPFSDLQARLNRKSVARAALEASPAFIRAYDLLARDGADLRPLPFAERRALLEDLIATARPARIDLSPLVPFTDWNDLARLRDAPPDAAIEGVMLKRRLSSYVPGRPKGEWWKWKRAPRLVDAVLMYAQRGHGKRSSYYSDFTFGVWRERDGGRELAPVGKAYFGFTDDELKALDRYVRAHTTNRFGPVRQVAANEDAGLVLEIAFDGLNRSNRHKSGVAMRFPRIHRIRWDKPAREADTLASLEALLDA